MRKKQPWYSFWLILPALVVFAPLGLFMLWKSPRKSRAKAVLTILYAFFLTAGLVWAVKTDFYGRYIDRTPPPEDVFDVRLNSRNRYVTPEVMPFEGRVFAAVVKEMRSERPGLDVDMNRDIVDVESLGTHTRAFETVAEQYNLDSDDVQRIYRKVAFLLAGKVK
ncbi:MAG: hypothetical protein KBC96_01405 [Armatimonadetes bacterium]|nr:hypothetical protein [Armatimonadota bacterium]